MVARMSWCASYEAPHPIGNNAGASAGVVRDVGGARAMSRLRLRLFFGSVTFSISSKGARTVREIARLSAT